MDTWGRACGVRVCAWVGCGFVRVGFGFACGVRFCLCGCGFVRVECDFVRVGYVLVRAECACACAPRVFVRGWRVRACASR
jgi:hypothetical protein